MKEKPFDLNLDDLDEEVVRDKKVKQQTPIQIRGVAKRQQQQQNKISSQIKEAIAVILHAKGRLAYYEDIRKKNLNQIVLPELIKDLNHIKQISDPEEYIMKKKKYISQFFKKKSDAVAFAHKHLKNV